MEFFCKICDFKTNKKSHYNSHILTKKHINNEMIIQGKKYACYDCGACFTYASGLSKHKKNLCKKSIAQLYKLSQSIPQNDTNKDILINDFIGILKTSAESTANMSKAIVSATETSQKSMHMLTFAIKKFPSAPPLRKLKRKEIGKSIEYFREEFKKIEYEKPTNSDQTKNNDDNCDNVNISEKDNKSVGGESNDTDDDSEEYTKKNIKEYAEIIVDHYNKKTLREFVGEIIKHCRHKKNPNDVPFWETDIQRLHFIVKYEGVTLNKSLWIKDECGSIIKNVVIVNLCLDIKKILSAYLTYLTSQDEINLKDKNADLSAIMTKKTSLVKISRMISKDGFHNKILKYIAPSFKFSDNMMEHYETAKNDSKFDKQQENANDVIYKKLYGIFRHTQITVYNNEFVLFNFEGNENIINCLLTHEDVVLCVYYKFYNEPISVQEITNIKKTSFNFFGNGTEKIFKNRITNAIPLIIYNTTPSMDEFDLLLKHKIKHIIFSKSKIKKYVFDLFEV